MQGLKAGRFLSRITNTAEPGPKTELASLLLRLAWSQAFTQINDAKPVYF